MLDIKLKLKPGHTTEREWMKPSPLKTLFWNVTYSCNFNCPICFTDAGKSQPEELSTKEAFKTIQKIHLAGVHDVIISGGEPFMRADMVHILEKMARFGISTRIASNGSLLTDKILTRLKHDTLTKSFQINLDTTDPELYEKLHGTSSSYHKVIATLRQIREHGFHTTVSVRLTPETILGIPRLLDLALAERWATVTIHIPLHIKRVGNCFPQDADFLSLLRPVFKFFLALPQRWLVETYIPWAEYHPVIRFLSKQVRVVNRGCRAGRDRLTINPTGMISPCVCLDIPEAYIGNIRQDNLLDNFNNSTICNMMKHPLNYGICEDCLNVKRCGGGCRVSAFVLSGSLDGPDKSCPIRKLKEEKRDSEKNVS